MFQHQNGKHGATHPAKPAPPPAATAALNAQLPPLSIYALNQQQQGLCRDHVSSELVNACGYAVKGPLPISDEAVQAWLRKQSTLIIAAETKWKVHRTAIAGVIAWEALLNVFTASSWVQWTRQNLMWNGIGYGPGKVHADASAVDAEQAGYLPPLDMNARRAKLATVSGGIDYIAAIMRGSADLLTCLGKYPTDRTYWNPAILAFCYHGWRFDKIKEKFGTGPNKLNFDNHKTFDVSQDRPAMTPWVLNNLSFLEAAVGSPPRPVAQAAIARLPNFRCQYAGTTKPCAQQGCPHAAAK